MTWRRIKMWRRHGERRGSGMAKIMAASGDATIYIMAAYRRNIEIWRIVQRSSIINQQQRHVCSGKSAAQRRNRWRKW